VNCRLSSILCSIFLRGEHAPCVRGRTCLAASCRLRRRFHRLGCCASHIGQIAALPWQLRDWPSHCARLTKRKAPTHGPRQGGRFRLAGVFASTPTYLIREQTPGGPGWSITIMIRGSAVRIWERLEERGHEITHREALSRACRTQDERQP
jgi:hypothetical protein